MPVDAAVEPPDPTAEIAEVFAEDAEISARPASSLRPLRFNSDACGVRGVERDVGAGARWEYVAAMAVAFTREEDYEAQAADLPDRPVSTHPNLVTASGLAAIEAELAAAREAYSKAQTDGGISSDRTAMARATRDLRYWGARRASAQLLEPDREDGVVQFGRTVEIEREDGRRQSFRIVGEDEADPAAGSVSYVSPLARALMGKSVGDVAEVGGAEVEVMAVR